MLVTLPLTISLMKFCCLIVSGLLSITLRSALSVMVLFSSFLLFLSSSKTLSNFLEKIFLFRVPFRDGCCIVLSVDDVLFTVTD